MKSMVVGVGPGRRDLCACFGAGTGGESPRRLGERANRAGFSRAQPPATAPLLAARAVARTPAA